MEKHGRAESSEDGIGFPGNVGKSRRNKVGKGKVESPVGGSAEGNGLSTETERVQLRGIGPRNGTPGGREGGDEEIG